MTCRRPTYLVCGVRDPDADAKSCQRDHVSHDLAAGVDPDDAASVDEANGEGPKGKEDNKGKCHENSVRLDKPLRRLLIAGALVLFGLREC